MYETIVVGIDGSKGSRKALNHAIDVARGTNAIVHLVSIVEIEGSQLSFGVDEVSELNDAANTLLEEELEHVDTAGVELKSAVRRGSIVPTIRTYAEEVDADVIVIGRRGEAGLAERLLGSVPDRLLRVSDRPVIVVPASSTEFVE